MVFEFRPARAEATNVLVAFAGPSGCGKTRSALRLARGLVGPSGKIAGIDTEARRMLQHAPPHTDLEFEHADFGPPYRPERVTEAIQAAVSHGYNAIILDSASHEYSGIGGIKEWADQLESSGVKSPGNWRDPKEAHRRMMNELLQCRVHLIFCLRAHEKIKVVPHPENPKKTVVVPMGWQPDCEKNFMFEMTASFLMTPDKPGVPVPIKHMQEGIAPAFPADQQVGEESGRILAAWANSGSARKVMLSLFGLDGVVVKECGKASEWLDAFRDSLDLVTGRQAQIIWDANKDTLLRIEQSAKERGNQKIVDAANAVGRMGLSKLGFSGEPA